MSLHAEQQKIRADFPSGTGGWVVCKVCKTEEEKKEEEGHGEEGEEEVMATTR